MQYFKLHFSLSGGREQKTEMKKKLSGVEYSLRAYTSEGPNKKECNLFPVVKVEQSAAKEYTS